MNTVNALKLGSCLGSRFDIDVIEFLFKECKELFPNDGMDESCTIEEILWDAVEQDLLEETHSTQSVSDLSASMAFDNSVFYKFTHDKVQWAAYSLIGESNQQQYHLCLAKSFIKLHCSPVGKQWMQMIAADHFCQAEPLITSTDDRDRAAAVCLRAAKHLQSTAAFRSAVIFVRNAILFLGDGDSCWTRNFALSLATYNLNAEAEFYAGNTEHCSLSVYTIIRNTREFEDQKNAYLVNVENLLSSRRPVEAMKEGKDMLRKMNVCQLPKGQTTAAHMGLEVAKTVLVLTKFGEEKLVEHKLTDDSAIEFFCESCIATVTSAHFAGSKENFVFFSLRALRLSLTHGYCKWTAPAMAMTAVVLGNLRLYSLSKKLCRVAQKVMQRFEAREADVLTLFMHYQFVFHMDNKLVNMGQKHTELYQLGISCGSIVWACLNSCVVISASFWEGSVCLDKLLLQANKYAEECVAYKKEMLLPVLSFYRQIILNLLGRNAAPSRLEGDAVNDMELFMADLDPANMRYFTSVATQCASFYWDWDEARRHAQANRRTETGDHPIYFVGLNRFWRCLVWISLYERDGERSMRRRARKEYRMIETMIRHGLENKRELLLILDAEFDARIKRKKRSSLSNTKAKYDKGIAAIDSIGFQHYGALVRERAGEFFAKNGEATTAKVYLDKAVEIYRDWKAMGKVRHLTSPSFPQTSESIVPGRAGRRCKTSNVTFSQDQEEESQPMKSSRL